MRNLRNPNRPQLPRVLGLLALIAVIAAVAGVATAGPKRGPSPKPPSGSSTAYQRVVASQMRALRRSQASVRKIARATAKKSPKLTQQKILLAGAADGNYLYWPRLVIDIRTLITGDDSNSYRYELIRTNRETGKDEVLLSKRGAYALSIYARGGRVAFQTFRATNVGNRVLLRSTIYTAAHGDATLSAPVVEKIKLGQGDAFCADMQNLSGISADGELIVGELHGTCDGGDQQELTSELKLWKSDGSKQDLGPAAPDAIFGSSIFGGGSSVRLAGGKLVGPSPYGPATAVRDLVGGTSTNLWSPAAKTFDIAADGTIAMIGSAPPTPASSGTYTGAYFSSAEKDKPPKPKYPFVIFPGGDADQPKLIAASKVRTEALQFCGDRLFAIVGGPAFDGLFGDASQEAEADSTLQLFPQFSLRSHEILVYDTQGTFIRSAAKVEQKGLAAVGCNGPNLVLGVAHGETVRATEVTP